VWIIGVLLALLIGSTSVDWNSIKDLPGIISFAVGLSSLILAVIAIFQTLTSSSSVESALAAVRMTAEDSMKTAQSLTQSAVLVKQVAEDARGAAAKASEASADFASKVAAVISSNETGVAEVARLREQMELNRTESSKAKEVDQIVGDDRQGVPDIFANKITLGGATATYIAVKSAQTGQKFNWRELRSLIPTITYYTAYLAALDDLGLIQIKIAEDGFYQILSIDPRISDYLERRKGLMFSAKEKQETFEKRVAAIDTYFKTTPV
jgi:hypothetical protein